MLADSMFRVVVVLLLLLLLVVVVPFDQPKIYLLSIRSVKRNKGRCWNCAHKIGWPVWNSERSNPLSIIKCKRSVAKLFGKSFRIRVFFGCVTWSVAFPCAPSIMCHIRMCLSFINHSSRSHSALPCYGRQQLYLNALILPSVRHHIQWITLARFNHWNLIGASINSFV